MEIEERNNRAPTHIDQTLPLPRLTRFNLLGLHNYQIRPEGLIIMPDGVIRTAV